MPTYYNKEGEVIDFTSWAQLMADDDYKRIKLDVVGHLTISTVWLGMNHNYSNVGPKQIFETMIFPAGSHNEQHISRYETEQEALDTHNELVASIQGGQSLY